MPEGCPFCEIAAQPTQWLDERSRSYVISPLRPVTNGHVLVIPKYHVADFASQPDLFGDVCRHAALYAKRARVEDWNLITSKGAAATQSVMHLHVHLVPRRRGDGLTLPWTKVRPT
jgi:histidine triad (HIT) family protein